MPADHVHDPELGNNAVEEWFAVGSMERALGLHNRHTGHSDSVNPIVTTALAHAGWRAGGDQWEGGAEGAEQALRRGMRLGESRG